MLTSIQKMLEMVALNFFIFEQITSNIFSFNISTKICYSLLKQVQFHTPFASNNPIKKSKGIKSGERIGDSLEPQRPIKRPGKLISNSYLI